MLALVPEYVRLLVNAMDFLIKEACIDNAFEVKYTKAKLLAERLYHDAPNWLQDAARDVVAHYFCNEQKEGRFIHHFISVEDITDIPYEQKWCLSILLPERMESLEEKRLHMVADWLHTQCSLWYKTTADINKNSFCAIAMKFRTHIPKISLN